MRRRGTASFVLGLVLVAGGIVAKRVFGEPGVLIVMHTIAFFFLLVGIGMWVAGGGPPPAGER